MSWERWFLAGAALFNAAWAVGIAVAPERVFAVVPPLPGVLAMLVAAEGLCFAVCALRRIPWLLALSIAGKALGLPLFLGAVHLGYLSASSWGLTVVNDLLWIPPLLAVWRSRRRW